MEIDRTGGARAASPLPAARAPQATRRVRPEATPGPGPAGGTVFDEAIDIHLGFDRQSGHLAIVGGDVRIEARLASQPAPGSLGAPNATGPDPRSIGSLVNFVA